MPHAKKEDIVRVNYTGRLEDGTVFDTSTDGDPLEFRLGAGEVIPGFEEAVIGMNEGAKKTVTLPSDQAYGPRREDLMIQVDRDKLPDDLKPEVGQRLAVELGEEQRAVVVVTEVTDAAITIDANHPLAGEALTFDIELVGLNP